MNRSSFDVLFSPDRIFEILPSANKNYANDDADKLQDVKVGGVTQKSYGYDLAGRTTSVVSSAGTTTLGYDYEGRISQITYPSTATNTFTYNGLDTRVGKVDSAGTSTYKRDGAGVTATVLNDGAAMYTPGISERRSSTTTFLHSGLKNADSQTGTSQTIGASRQSDAFGNVLSSSGTWKGPFGYAGSFGYQEDADSSLKLLGHRYYDGSTGRFLTRDPVKDGRNWYGYCENNPVQKVDPNGLEDKFGWRAGGVNNRSHYPVLIVFDKWVKGKRQVYFDWLPAGHGTTNVIDVDYIWTGKEWVHVRGSWLFEAQVENSGGGRKFIVPLPISTGDKGDWPKDMGGGKPKKFDGRSTPGSPIYRKLPGAD